MKKSLVCLGNSHLSATMQVLEAVAAALDLAPVFLVSNWIVVDELMAALSLLLEGDRFEITVNHPSGPCKVDLNRNDITGFVTSGPPYSGPGDFFRCIAGKSFTGSFVGVPGAAEVRCPYPYPASPPDHFLSPGDIPDGLLSSHCLESIFSHYLTQQFDKPLAKKLDEISRVHPVLHLPTPPMPGNTVIHRFGHHVHDSSLGILMNKIWEQAGCNRLHSGARILPVAKDCVTDNGWLNDTYANNGHPYLDIHANSRYGAMYFQDIYDFLFRITEQRPR
jgi:hypothetical protein